MRLLGCPFSNILLIAFMATTRASLVLHLYFSISPPGLGGGLLAALDLFQETQMFSRGDSGPGKGGKHRNMNL